MIDQWIYNIKNMGPMQEVAFKSKNEMKNARDALNQMRYAYNDGEAKGFAKGKAEGRAEGKAEGRAETIAEKIQEAREMGLPEDIIARLFGS